MPEPLAGLEVVVTRPAHQAGNLVRLLESAGARVIRLPLIAIGPPADEAPARALIRCLDTFHLAVFVSPNAVEHGLAMVREAGALPAGLQVAAVGAATGAALQRAGVRVDLIPDQRQDSEGLLALPALREMAGRRVAIFRGEGGRELLAESLRARGASVEYVEVYRRLPPRTGPEPLLGALDRGGPDVITLTSAEALRNLVALLPEPAQPRLRAVALLVVSERLAQAARELGWRAPVRVSGPGDAAMVQALGGDRGAPDSGYA